MKITAKTQAGRTVELNRVTDSRPGYRYRNGQVTLSYAGIIVATASSYTYPNGWTDLSTRPDLSEALVRADKFIDATGLSSE